MWGVRLKSSKWHQLKPRFWLEGGNGSLIQQGLGFYLLSASLLSQHAVVTQLLLLLAVRLLIVTCSGNSTITCCLHAIVTTCSGSSAITCWLPTNCHDMQSELSCYLVSAFQLSQHAMGAQLLLSVCLTIVAICSGSAAITCCLPTNCHNMHMYVFLVF